MFTGLVEEIGFISKIQPLNGSLELTIAATRVTEDIRLGDSICVSGVCLTATAATAGSFSASASPETLSLTTLGSLAVGSAVNLERSVTLQTRLGGHNVQGHVDGTATVQEITPEGDSQRWTFTASPDLLKYMVHKGSVTVNGVSLTVASLSPTAFSVALIPKTLELTTFQHLHVGDQVNIETDIFGRYIYTYLQQAGILTAPPADNI